jgi:GTP-binding protein
MRTVAIVGRPNVGKSALFNRLAEKKISIVHDRPGVTRDRIVAECSLGRAPFQIIDTGGIGAGADAEFADQVEAEVMIAVEASDLILFVVDAHDGLTPVDTEIARMLRRSSKPVILVVNKVDHQKHSQGVTEFMSLGYNPVMPVSAEHAIGFDDLVHRTESLLPADEPSETRGGQVPLKIAIVGRPNVGKSSLTNAILEDDRTLVSAVSGTTRDAVDIPYQRGDQNYILIDTAGIRQRTKRSDSVEVFSVLRSESSIRRADICCLVIDAAQGVTSQDKRIAGMVCEAGKPCVIALNKSDLVREQCRDKESLTEFLENIKSELFFINYAPVSLMSAKTGDSLDRLFKRIENVREASRKRLGTGVLNRLFSSAMTNHPPGAKAGRRFKLLYATQPNPRDNVAVPVPEIVLFCNDDTLLDDGYRRFLEGRIRDQVSWTGLPIHFHLRARTPSANVRKRGRD